jgi:ABC-type transport system substrate-binding protein
VNFGGWNDPEINALLEQGRAAATAEEQLPIYEDLNREFAKKLYNLWSGYTLWSIASKTNVNGVFGPPLPDGSEYPDGLATGHPLLGLWVAEG